jgi:amidase
MFTPMIAPLATVVEADIAQLGDALRAGSVTSVELVARYLNRIAFYDRGGIALNSVIVLNPAAFAEARAADERRARDEARGALDGIPFTAKDSYCVTGLPVAAGSPAFADLIAQDDAFAIARLRDAGAVFLGLTNMPPMAAGGMQRGLYGRAESPYNAEYLTSAFGSGSSNGSGTATAASFAAFGLGEETWSSGRAPASHNALVAYTPSRGMISVRGNWPLVPTMDVVVPHTRTPGDLAHVLDAILVDDPDTAGDLWRSQPWVALPRPSDVRPSSFADLPAAALAGLRLAVPRVYVNADGTSAHPVETRASVMALWQRLCAELEDAGAEVVEVDFPAVSNYEKLHAESRDFVDRGFVPREFLADEIGDLSVWAFDRFLRLNGDPHLNRLADVDPARIFPHPADALPDRYGVFPFDIAYDLGDYVGAARGGVRQPADIPSVEKGLRGLEQTRRVDVEDWLAAEGYDAVIFPTHSDVGPADADVNEASADIAWRNGVWVSNGNLVPRHLGIPTVTVPMGMMDDTGMPVGLTIAGPAYADARLMQLATAIDGLRPRRVAPPRTPVLPDEALFHAARPASAGALEVRVDRVRAEREGDRTRVSFSATLTGPATGSAAGEGCPVDDVVAFVDGVRATIVVDGSRIEGTHQLAADAHTAPVSEWLPPFGPLVVVVARDRTGAVVGAFGTTEGSPL